MRRHCLFATLALSLVACGGATKLDLFGGNGSPTDSGTPPFDGPPEGIDAGFDASPPEDAPGLPESSIPDSPPPEEVGPPDTGPVDPGIYCGTNGTQDTYCPIKASDCCVTNASFGGTPAYACQVPAAPTDCTNGAGIPVECDDPADCPGQICCGVKQNGQYAFVRCQSSCSGGNDVHFCDPTATPDFCTTLGLQCRSSTLLPGYHVCN